MTLHVFNPEHDIALAYDLENFTAPHAGRQLRHDLGFLPLLWADADDRVMVDDVDTACRAMQRVLPKIRNKSPFSLWQERLSTSTAMVSASSVDAVEPWGWDAAIRRLLLRRGVCEDVMPGREQIDAVRRLSHRRVAGMALRQVREQLSDIPLVGESFECTTPVMIDEKHKEWGSVILKAPWSSSGRGLRFLVDNSRQHEGWIRNMLQAQGSILVEPFYDKVKDFGMEFYADGKGGITFLGLSVFHTQNGAYTGNLLATEEYKMQVLTAYVPTGFILSVQQKLSSVLSDILGTDYSGPLGVDMMIVATKNQKGFCLHPCVEINLRRTMGHVALSLTKLVNPSADDDLVRVMRIVYEDNIYKLKIQRL
jgi:hypothetical protein